ncbi:reverse transcriptase domain-containing protein [Tanacetum coccineum]
MLPTRRATRTTPATTTTPTTTVTEAQLQALIDQGVAAALAERDASRSRDGDNSHGSGTGGRRQVPTQRECTYTDFLKCQPINFKGTEGVVGLTQWAEKMESVFLISNCAITNQVKFASCTLQGSALTWWNSHVRAVGQDVAYTMPWTALKRMITDKYCPRGEIKKLESEYWNLKVRAKVENVQLSPRWAMYSKFCLCTKLQKAWSPLVDCKVFDLLLTDNNNNNHQRTKGQIHRDYHCFECECKVTTRVTAQAEEWNQGIGLETAMQYCNELKLWALAGN